VVDWEKDIYRGKYADVSDEEERKKKDLELKRREGSGLSRAARPAWLSTRVAMLSLAPAV
jgi:hypothetical protein